MPSSSASSPAFVFPLWGFLPGIGSGTANGTANGPSIGGGVPFGVWDFPLPRVFGAAGGMPVLFGVELVRGVLGDPVAGRLLAGLFGVVELIFEVLGDPDAGGPWFVAALLFAFRSLCLDVRGGCSTKLWSVRCWAAVSRVIT